MVICENCNHEMKHTGPCLCPLCGYIMHEAIKKGYKKPNKETLKAIKETEQGIGLTTFSDAETFIKEIENGD